MYIFNFAVKVFNTDIVIQLPEMCTTLVELGKTKSFLNITFIVVIKKLLIFCGQCIRIDAKS